MLSTIETCGSNSNADCNAAIRKRSQRRTNIEPEFHEHSALLELFALQRTGWKNLSSISVLEMIIPIDGLDVYWPYEYVYKEQYQYMLELKRTLDAKGHCLLEMPSGTGKTVSLLSLLTSYMATYPNVVKKLAYCTRTVPEIEKVLEELKVVLAYRKKELGDADRASTFLSVGLSSRKNLCINPTVSQFNSRIKVDSACRDRTAPWVREEAVESTAELCGFFEGWQTKKDSFQFGGGAPEGEPFSLTGVHSIHDLRGVGEQYGVCPYFLARRMIAHASIVVYAYPYLLDQRIAEKVAQDLGRETVIVFDEAHNIDNACIEGMSVRLTKPMLEAATSNLAKLNSAIVQTKASGSQRLRDEYDRLVQGLRAARSEPGDDDLATNPVLPEDVLSEAVPGNIRKAEHFVVFMKRFVEYLKTRMMTQHVVHDPPLLFLDHLQRLTYIEAKPLRFCAERLNSLMRTLQLQHTEEFYPLTMVAAFGALLGTYRKGFALLIEPFDERMQTKRPVIQMRCLDASLALRPVFQRFNSVVITSGTLSPLDMYPKILDFQPKVVVSLPMTLTRNCLCPMVVTRGSDQVTISTKFDKRTDQGVVRNFGQLLVEMSAVVPDGIVCFFTSYSYMEEVIGIWHNMGIINDVLANKLVFIETTDAVETALALENYKKACDCGRGAVLLSVARGKVSEGIDFSHHYGRAVLMFGIPFVHTESRSLRARLEYLRDQYDVRQEDFLVFDAMRTAAQCLGRCIRTKSDYGIMVLADKRYSRIDKRSKLPKWISQFMTDTHLNLSSDMAVSLAKNFLREMAQPMPKEDQIGLSMLSQQHINELVARAAARPALPMPAGSARQASVPTVEELDAMAVDPQAISDQIVAQSKRVRVEVPQ